MDRLNINKIINSLQTDVFGKKIEYFTSINSTNDYAKNISKQQECHGTAVLAEEQTRGRGRQGSKWSSISGQGVLMSIILKPLLAIEDGMKFSLLAGLVVQETLQKLLNNSVFIKWPNDIVINNKKICGILTENIIIGDKIDAIVVGIGINVGQRESFFEEYPYGSSIKLQCGEFINREEIIIEILNNFESTYNKFLESKKLDIEKYTQVSILMNKEVRVIKGNETFLGKVIGFNQKGMIRININDEILEFSTDSSIRGLNGYID